VVAHSIASWDGSEWSALGEGSSLTVEAMAVFDDGLGGGPALYAGGWFPSIGPIARWSCTMPLATRCRRCCATSCTRTSAAA